jgi:hypothetical protein
MFCHKKMAMITFWKKILKKYGLNWDGIPNPQLKFTDLDNDAFRMFIEKGIQSGRLTKKHSR